MFFDNMLKAAIYSEERVLGSIQTRKYHPRTLVLILVLFPSKVKPNCTTSRWMACPQLKELEIWFKSKSTDGNIKKTRVRMTVGPLNFTSNGVARFSGVSIKRNYLGTIDRMDCETTMIGNKQTQTVRVTNYDIKKLVGLKLKSMDRRFLDPITNRLISGVMGVFSNRVKQANANLTENNHWR